MLAKEVVAIMALVAAAAAWSADSGWRGVLRSAALAVPAFVVVGALIVIVPGSGTDAMAYLKTWWADGLGSLGAGRVTYLVAASYGALWLLVPKGFFLLRGHLRTALAVSLCVAVLLPAVGSPERMEELIFPVVVAAAAVAANERSTSLGVTLGVGNVLFLARIGGDAQIPSLAAWLGLFTAVILAVWCYVPGSWLSLAKMTWRWPRVV